VPEAAVETALMWEFVFSTVAGIAGGLLFQFYFRRRERGVEAVPSVDRPRKRERL
jgi:cytochrome c-type biogenesis protein CcmH/NrfF